MGNITFKKKLSVRSENFLVPNGLSKTFFLDEKVPPQLMSVLEFLHFARTLIGGLYYKSIIPDFRLRLEPWPELKRAV